MNNLFILTLVCCQLLLSCGPARPTKAHDEKLLSERILSSRVVEGRPNRPLTLERLDHQLDGTDVVFTATVRRPLCQDETVTHIERSHGSFKQKQKGLCSILDSIMSLPGLVVLAIGGFVFAVSGLAALKGGSIVGGAVLGIIGAAGIIGAPYLLILWLVNGEVPWHPTSDWGLCREDTTEMAGVPHKDVEVKREPNGVLHECNADVTDLPAVQWNLPDGRTLGNCNFAESTTCRVSLSVLGEYEQLSGRPLLIATVERGSAGEAGRAHGLNLVLDSTEMAHLGTKLGVKIH